jgi:AP-3 complex subunit mu
MVLELLHRMANIFEEYFGRADEMAIKDNFSTVYQLLEEMIDFGWPLTTESNALKAMIRPPNLMSKLFASSTVAVSDELPSGTVSNMPWRTAGVYYTNNEIYMDIIEEVDAIVDMHGRVVSADVQGSIQCQSHLSGVPDLLLTFSDPSLIEDCGFHPCVRYARFENQRVVSFVPPDGKFELMRYRINPDKVQAFVPPLFCNAQWSRENDSTGRLSLQVGVTTLSSLVFSASARKSGTTNSVEDVSVLIPFPKRTKSTSDFRVSMGSVLYDEANKVACWNVSSNMTSADKATLSCKFTVGPPPSTPAAAAPSSSSVTKIPLASITSTTASSSWSCNKLFLDNCDYDDGMGDGMSERRRRLCSRHRRMQQRRRGTNHNNNETATNWLSSPPHLSLGWKIPLASVSGLSVSGLSVSEAYRPYKGVRNITKSGLFQVRCS